MTNIVLTALMHTVFLTNWHDFHTVEGPNPGSTNQTNQVHQIAVLKEQSFVEVDWQGETLKVLARERDVIPNPPITRVIDRVPPVLFSTNLLRWDTFMITNYVINTSDAGHGNTN